ncbi:YidH family protein [Metabacillus halosaccharovorans]|uniref:DUF202 domain-containing protein n=1 Tax=Metabacillus halosaccharovorans TaxID=930124 RepID=A0ABT3DL63_9BACI|nr:DUF202 domain-containing protein [Metabacillus halosaccharovorans]MCV9887271.1 DUF202 domain-containing protein [Metabacillus halosaccharovorans]
MEKDLEQKQKTIDSKYIQQHLANERTFLAWIRTAIAIIGVGFLVSNLHENMEPNLSQTSDYLANIIGITSVGVGIMTIIMATIAYLRKYKAINDQTFRTPKITVITLGIFVIVIAFIFGIYFVLI